MKIITVCGTRPELIRMSVTLKKFDSLFDHVFVHTGQNYDYELNEIFYTDLDIRKPDYYLNAAGKNLGQTMAKIISKSFDLFVDEKPDAIVILGDTNSALAALSAKRLHIPIFHLEAGNRSFSNQVPEEVNRKIVDAISDINVCYSQTAKNNLISEGHTNETVFVSGSPIKEVFTENKVHIHKSQILSQLKLSSKKYILLSVHREENVDNIENLKALVDSVNAVQRKYNLPIIFPMHPRTSKTLAANELAFNSEVKILKPLGYLDYCFLQLNSLMVISDSGSIVEESYILGFRAISLRKQIERQEGIESNTVIMSGLFTENLLLAINAVLNSTSNNKIPDYDRADFSDTIIKLIISYHPYVHARKFN